MASLEFIIVGKDIYEDCHWTGARAFPPHILTWTLSVLC